MIDIISDLGFQISDFMLSLIRSVSAGNGSQQMCLSTNPKSAIEI